MMIKQGTPCKAHYKNTKTGRFVKVYEAYNKNTGNIIAWLSVSGQKTMRFTGKNIAKLYALIEEAKADGELVIV
jgi:hypothetical protein